MQLSGKTFDFSMVWLTCTENGDYMEGVRMQGTKCKGRSPFRLTSKRENGKVKFN